MSWLIIILVLILVFSALAGFRRGLIESSIGLAGFVVALFLAFNLYKPLGSVLSSTLGVSFGISNFAGFLAILLIFQLLYSLFIVILLRVLIKKENKNKELAHWDKSLGFIPGIVSGWLFGSLLILAILIMPIGSDFKQRLQENKITKTMAYSISFLSNSMKELFVPVANDTQLALTNINQALLPETNELNFEFPETLSITFDEQAENQMLKLINKERKNLGLNELVMDPRVQEVARQHSLEMFKLSYFDHNSPISGTAFNRLQSAEIEYVAAGENIAYAPSVEMAHNGLMNSPGHRKNILSKEFKKVGIGIASAGNWGNMYTQNFTN